MQNVEAICVYGIFSGKLLNVGVAAFEFAFAVAALGFLLTQ